MRVEVLGPVRLSTDDGVPVEVAERHLRLLLASLAATDGEPVSADTLIDRLWDGGLPTDPRKVLQAKLSRLRTNLDQATPGARQRLTHTPAGYRLVLDAGELDAGVFKSKVERACRMGPSARKVEAITEALTLWRGDPFGDVADAIWLAPILTDLHDIRGDAFEALIETHLDEGDPQQALNRAKSVLADYATREGLVGSVMLALYQVGRQHEALELFETLRQRLAEDLGVDPTPRIRELHGRILRQDSTLTSKSGAEPTVEGRIERSNIPAPTSPLIGRERESEQIEALLGDTRLVTLTGIGGVGKTRLALHVAHEQTPAFARGTWFIDLTELPKSPEGHFASGERIASLTASTLALPEHPGVTTPLDRLGEALGSRDALLVLDNCEHVIAEAAVFTAVLLRKAPRTKVLATSREPLGLPGEQLYDVDTLNTEPTADGGINEAVAFFLARAQASDPTFHRDDDNADAIEQLCRRLDGLPLALELAAARIRVLSLNDVLERIDDRLNLLRRPSHAASQRHRTLRGMIDWSWSLLDAPEQAVLRRLAVHSCSTVDLDAAAAICSDQSEDAEEATVKHAEVVDILLRLVDRSLVTTTSTPTGMRYGLLESIYAYARERLDASEEGPATAQRHLHYYRDLAHAADAGLRTRRQRHWLARFSAERTQLALAFDEALRRSDGRGAAALVLATFWYEVCVPGFAISPWIGGYHAQLNRNLQAVLALTNVSADDRASMTTLAACIQANPADAAASIEEALSGFAAAEPVFKARVQWFAGASLLSIGLREPGEKLIDHALPILADHGQDWDLAVATCRRDWLLITMWRETPRGLPDGRDLREVLREVDDGYGSMYALSVEHRTAELVGEHRRSGAAVAEALAVSRELGIETETSLWLTGSAIAAIREGDLDDALEQLAESRAISTEIGFTVGVAYADFAESMIARQGDDTARARTLLGRWRRFTWAARAELLTEFERGFLAVQQEDMFEAFAAFDALVSSTPQPRLTGTTARLLELAAAIHDLRDKPLAAAELLGTAEAVRARANAEPSVPERRDIDRIRHGIRQKLSGKELSEAMTRGGEDDPIGRLRTVALSAPPHAPTR